MRWRTSCLERRFQAESLRQHGRDITGIIRQRILMDTGTEIWKRKNTGRKFSLDTVILTGKICRYYFRSGTDFPTHHSTSASGLYARKRIPWNLQCLCRIRVEPMPGRRQCRSMRHSRRPEWKKKKSGWDSPKQNVCCRGKYSSWRLKYQKTCLQVFRKNRVPGIWKPERMAYGSVPIHKS